MSKGKSKTKPAAPAPTKRVLQKKRSVSHPEQLTDFGRFLESVNISYASAGADLGITRSYTQMLATGSATPQLVVGGQIEIWSGGEVKLQSWLPFCARWPTIVATTKSIVPAKKAS